MVKSVPRKNRPDPRLFISVLCALITPLVDAQRGTTSAPAFEVGSIKRSPLSADAPIVRTAQVSPDRWVAQNASARALLVAAFPEHATRGHILGIPAALMGVQLDINAKAPGPASAAEMRVMLRQLLSDRFAFIAHVEERVVEHYALMMSRADRSLGRNLTPAAVDCSAWEAARRRNEPAPPPPSTDPKRPSCGETTEHSPGVMTLHGGGMTMSWLAASLEGFYKQYDFPVEDRTALQGRFDITLTFGLQRGVGAEPFSGPRIEDALRDQLGLKLEVQREPHDVLVVDRLQMPTID